MSMNKTLLAVALLAASGSAFATDGDSATANNIKWLYDYGNLDENGIVITNSSNDIVDGSFDFQLEGVDPATLELDSAGTTGTLLIAQNYADDDTSGTYTAGETLTPVPGATWKWEKAEYIMTTDTSRLVLADIAASSQGAAGELVVTLDDQAGTVGANSVEFVSSGANSDFTDVLVKYDTPNGVRHDVANYDDVSEVFIVATITAIEKA